MVNKTDIAMMLLRQAKERLETALAEIDHALRLREKGFPREAGEASGRARKFTQAASKSFDEIVRVFTK